MITLGVKSTNTQNCKQFYYSSLVTGSKKIIIPTKIRQITNLCTITVCSFVLCYFCGIIFLNNNNYYCHTPMLMPYKPMTYSLQTSHLVLVCYYCLPFYLTHFFPGNSTTFTKATQTLPQGFSFDQLCPQFHKKDFHDSGQEMEQ